MVENHETVDIVRCQKALEVSTKRLWIARDVHDVLIVADSFPSEVVETCTRRIHNGAREVKFHLGALFHVAPLSYQALAELLRRCTQDTDVVETIRHHVVFGSVNQMPVDLHGQDMSKQRSQCHSVTSSPAIEFQKVRGRRSVHCIHGTTHNFQKPLNSGDGDIRVWVGELA